eukprot:270277-Amphidinium_carterae.1
MALIRQDPTGSAEDRRARCLEWASSHKAWNKAQHAVNGNNGRFAAGHCFAHCVGNHICAHGHMLPSRHVTRHAQAHQCPSHP